MVDEVGPRTQVVAGLHAVIIVIFLGHHRRSLIVFMVVVMIVCCGGGKDTEIIRFDDRLGNEDGFWNWMLNRFLTWGLRFGGTSIHSLLRCGDTRAVDEGA